jgi:hypothetical protein
MTGDKTQWYLREQAWIKYNKNITIPIKMKEKDFETAFNMGYKQGRKLERRVNFKYLIKTKYHK